MATIMSWGDDSGTHGRCDAKCHKAKNPNCVCMCGGSFHGSANQPGGVEQAVRNYWEDAVAESTKRVEEKGMKLETDKWLKNRQRILRELQPKPVKKKPAAYQYQLPLEVANVR